MKPIIELKNISFKFENHLILDNVNFHINKGEIAFIFGANGTGKSTLLKLILGIYQQNSGEIIIDGKLRNSKLVSKYFGYVPQYSSIERHFPISVQEIIDLECSLSNSSCSTETIDHLKVLGAQNLIHKRVDELSGGEFQKVLIARALTSSPSILIMDEPINNLDDKTQKDLMNMIYKLNKEKNLTIIIVSHDFNIVDHKSKSKILYISENTVSVETEDSLLHKNHLNTQHIHGHN